MNNLIVPPSPNWYESKVLTCTLDNTLIYGSRNEIVVIKPQPLDQPADIRIIPQAHYDRIVSVDASPNWESSKSVISTGDDKLIKHWDLEKYQCCGTLNIHTTVSEKLVGSCFAGNDRVVSVSENGFLSIWRTSNNEVIPLKNLFNFKVHVTCISSCIHAPWLTAFGLKCGLIVLADIRKSGKILYKLRGHDKSVVALSWCPTPFNIFPKNLPSKTRRIFNTDKSGGDASLKETTTSLIQGDSQLDEIKEGQTVNSSVAGDSSGEGQIINSLTPTEAENGQINSSLEENNSTTNNDAYSKETVELIQKDLIMTLTEILEAQDTNTTSEKNSPEMLTETENQTATDNLITESDRNPQLLQNTSEFLCNKNELCKELDFPSVNEGIIPADDSAAISHKVDDFLMECDLLKEQILKLNEISAESKSHQSCNEDLNSDLMSDRELDNEIQEIFQPTKEYLLASSARGGSIYIWRAGTDGRIQKELPVGSKAKRKNYRSSDRAWITICWITPEILLSSSLTGELLQWDLLKTSQNSSIPQKKLIHHDHRTNLFCIAAPINVYQTWEEENWRDRKNLHAWTIGQDRFLLNTSLMADRTTLSVYPTIGGYVYCLISSPVDPCRIAVGIGDNTAKVWDLSRPHLQCILMSNLWQKIQSRVLTLAWHPLKEMLLAYGTFEGRIGIVNTNNISKLPVLLCQFFRTSVYNIEWGPIEGSVDDLGLYACGEGKLVVYNTDKPTDDPVLVDVPAKEYVTHMSWKPNYALLAVATKSGAIILYDLHLKHLMTVYGEYKTIQTLQWHPEATADDTSSSPYAFWLATGTNNSCIPVYDFSGILNEGEANRKYSVVTVLNGHTKPVKKLAWSSYEGGKLASCGEDGIAYIWDVKTGTILAMYVNQNFEPILSILWSPLDKNYVIVGGKDQTIRIWNIVEHPPKSETDLAELLKARNKLKAEFKKNSQRDDGSDDEKQIKIKRDQMLPCITSIQNANADALIEDCKRLLDRIDTKECDGNNKIDVLKLFGDRESMINILEVEQKKHDQAGKFIRTQHLSLWKGDIAETIQEAVKQGNVTPWLISMAPMVSHKLWQETCEAYVKKLMENAKSDPIETASYLLACHKVDEAVQILTDATLFREALAVAKCRLPVSDPIINDVIQKWATYNIVCGSYEVAAQCFIYLRQYEEAAKALFKRTSPKVLEFAVKLAEMSGNKDLLDAVITRYNSFKINEEKEIDTANDKTAETEDMSKKSKSVEGDNSELKLKKERQDSLDNKEVDGEEGQGLSIGEDVAKKFESLDLCNSELKLIDFDNLKD